MFACPDLGFSARRRDGLALAELHGGDAATCPGALTASSAAIICRSVARE